MSHGCHSTHKRSPYKAVCQGGYYWGKALQVSLDLPSGLGWTDSNNWKPLWITLSEASISSRELIHCICKTGYKGQCKCKREAIELLLLLFFKSYIGIFSNKMAITFDPNKIAIGIKFQSYCLFWEL